MQPVNSLYRIVADENIPLVQELFSSLGTVRLLPGRKMQAADLEEADILLVRSTTLVNKELLANSAVKFVGSATTGTDHVDVAWLQEKGITFASAKGCNALAVAEYVLCVIAALRKLDYLKQKNCRAGVVGVGHVGSLVAEKLRRLGFDVIENDPPRAAIEKTFRSTPLSDFTALDLICLHTPLTRAGDYPTHHLINQFFLNKLKPDCIILNAGRGAVINTSDFNQYSTFIRGCFDVWEHEPDINLMLLKNAIMATPHIAGYTREAKLRGTFMLYQAVKNWLNSSAPDINEATYFPQITLPLDPSLQSWEEILLKVYNPIDDKQKMRHLLLSENADVATCFDEMRKQHQRRVEFNSISLTNTVILKQSDRELLKRLGFKFA